MSLYSLAALPEITRRTFPPRLQYAHDNGFVKKTPIPPRR